MSSSLPKIKILTNNSESGSQKNLKFKKIHINSTQSVPDVREKMRSVSTQRLKSLSRYSSTEEKRQYKKQKMQINLIQRKLLSGTFDEALEKSNYLQNLKQKTDYFKTQSTLRMVQTNKLRLKIDEMRKQTEHLNTQKFKKQQEFSKINSTFEKQKTKTQNLLMQVSIYKQMIQTNKNVNSTLQNKLNQDKNYLFKLQNQAKRNLKQNRETDINVQNLLFKQKQINQQLEKQQKDRQQLMLIKHSFLSKKVQNQKLLDQRSKVFREALDEADVEYERKNFMELYNGILANIFAQKYSQQRLQTLYSKYQVMENSYSKISSYKKFQDNEPKQMIKRFFQLQPQKKQQESQTKILEQTLVELQKQNSILLLKFEESYLTSSRPLTSELKQQQKRISQKNNARTFNQQQTKLISKINEQWTEISELNFRIKKWVEKQVKNLKIKCNKNENWQEISSNINNILTHVLQTKNNI